MTYAIERLMDEIEEKGIEKGREEGRIEIIRELLANGESLEKLAKIAKLSQSEIKDLQEY